jgi:predicted ArsR family transcriptional regulator
MLRKHLLDTTRGRIVGLLQRGGLTAHDIASSLDLTPTAIRAHLTAMERDGLVLRAGQRSGTTRPANLFELTPEVEHLLSRAYLPFLTQLVEVFSEGLPSSQLDALMREAGRSLAAGISRPSGSLEARVRAASELLNEQLGALTHVEKNGRLVIRGVSCPLAALTGKQPAVCLAIESLVGEIVGSPVKECCDRSGRPACCFEVEQGGR